MNKLTLLTCMGAVAFAGYSIHNAHAQTTSAAVGNPDSANVLIIQEGYEVVAPVGPNDMNGNVSDANWTKDGKAEVAPLPQDTQPSDENANDAEDFSETEDSLMQKTTPDSETIIQTEESIAE